jgi:hypothetical protein
MKLRILGLLAALLFVHACEFGSAPGGGGSGGEGLTGILVDGKGAAVANAKVWVYPDTLAILAKAARASAVRIDSTTTDASGRYDFVNLTAGRYNLTASYTRRDTTYAFFLAGIEYPGGRADLGADTLRAASTVWAYVGDAEGIPVTNASCEIPGSPWRTFTDSLGRCEFKGVAGGEFTIRVLSASGRVQAEGVVTVIPGQIPVACQITLSEPPAAPPSQSPAAVVLAGPGPGDSVTVDSALSWLNTHPANVSSYRVQVFQDTLAAPVREENVSPDPVSKTLLLRFSSGPLSLLPGRYFWRVIAEGPGGSTASSWRSVVIRDWKHLSLLGYNFQAPLDWVRSDSTTVPDSAWIRYGTYGNERGWLRLVETNERPKPDLSLKENYAAAGEISLGYPGRRATLVTYTESQGSQTLQGARVDFWTLSEENTWIEDATLWFEAGASTSAGWQEVQAALASLRIPGGTSSNPPDVRTLVAPENGATGVALPATLSWKAIDMMDFGQFFRVQVFVDTPYAAMVVSDSVHRNTPSRDANNYYHTVGPLKPGTTYHWRVLAWGSNVRGPGDTSYSAVRKFTTAPNP